MGFVKLLFLISFFFHSSLAARKLTALVQDQPMPLQYHNGPLLSGTISLNLIWYGSFKPSQRAIVADFLTSLSSPSQSQPSVYTWWKATEKYFSLAHIKSSNKKPLLLTLGKQILDENCSLGKSLSSKQIVGPNNDVGLDGMVINIASLLAGTVTNPFGNGFFQGPKEAPLEAASACPGVYGKGAFPGYAGDLLVDESTGASYNAHGANGRKYLLPALMDPTTSSCSTVV